MNTTETMIDVSAVEALGYTVEQPAETGRFRPVYFLNGPRGARYALIRCERNDVPSHYLAVFSTRRFGAIKAHGYQHFTDRNGVLRPCR